MTPDEVLDTDATSFASSSFIAVDGNNSTRWETSFSTDQA